MRVIRIWTALGLLLVADAAIAKQKPAPNMTGKKEQSMANCPSSVPGAATRIENRTDGVELTITASDPKAQAEIRRRAKRQEDVALQTERGAIEHTGEGTGSGRFGFCPGMIENTTVRVEDVPDGAKLTVHANQPADVQKLQKLTAKRAAALRTHL